MWQRTSWIGAVCLGSTLATLFIATPFIDLGLFKRTYLPRLEEALNRRLDVGQVKLTLAPALSLRVSNLRVFDGSPENTVFSSEQVFFTLKFWPLLAGRVEASELVLDRPVFNFRQSSSEPRRDGDQSPGKRSHPPRPEGKNVPAKDAISSHWLPANLIIRDGQFKLTGQGQPPIHVKGIDLALRGISGTGPFPYRASFDYPGLKRVALEGALDYQHANALLRLRDNKLTIATLTLPVRGDISDVSGTPRINLDLKTDNVDAKTIFEILSVFGLAPANTEVAGPMDVTVNVSGSSNNLTTRLRGVLKDVTIHGRRALKGRFRGEISLHIPTGSAPVSRRLQGNGRLAAHDGALTHGDLIRRIEQVSGMIGFSKEERRLATTFQRMEADFTFAGGYARFTRLYLANPQWEASGNGTVTLDQATLDMAVDTALSREASARAGRGRMTTYLKDKQGRIVVPLTIRGPLQDPSVDLNARKFAERRLPQNAERGFRTLAKRMFHSR